MEDTEKLVVRMKVDCLWKEKADGGIPFFLYFFLLFLFRSHTVLPLSPYRAVLSKEYHTRCSFELFKRQLDLRILLLLY